MNPTSLSTQPAAPSVPKRRWWLRGVLAALALGLATALGLFTYAYVGVQGDWAAAEAEAALDDPRWRLSDMEADRPQIADADNSALYIIALQRKGRISVWSPNYETIFEKLPVNAQLNGQQVELIRASFGKVPGQIEAARKLKDMPEGRFPIKYSDDWISTLIPHHQETREVVSWLQHDAWLLAQEGDCDAAIESCQAILNASRSVKDDPFLITCLIRIAEQSIALQTLERVLAQGEASEEHLRAMQAMLERELRDGGSSLLLTMRGERAGNQYLFENLRAGKVKQNPFLLLGRGGANPGLGPVQDWLVSTFPSSTLKHYPDHLRNMNRLVATARLPLHERGDKMAKIEREIVEAGNPVSRLLVPATAKVEKADRRVHIHLRSMIVILACERFRLQDQSKRWPASLDELVKAKLLAAVPTDPMDNQPLRYRRTPDGIVVYSVGFDGKDNQGNIQREQPYLDGVDLGYRLWDVEKRRRPPLPPVGVPGGN